MSPKRKREQPPPVQWHVTRQHADNADAALFAFRAVAAVLLSLQHTMRLVSSTGDCRLYSIFRLLSLSTGFYGQLEGMVFLGDVYYALIEVEKDFKHCQAGFKSAFSPFPSHLHTGNECQSCARSHTTFVRIVGRLRTRTMRAHLGRLNGQFAAVFNDVLHVVDAVLHAPPSGAGDLGPTGRFFQSVQDLNRWLAPLRADGSSNPDYMGHAIRVTAP